MQVTQLLRELDLGNSVAEFDADLENYFIETDTFRKVVRDDVDVISGDKGTGKTALFRIVSKRYRAIDELQEVEVVPAFNPSGSPIFQRLTQQPPLREGQYASIWKGYILALVGNWVLQVFDGAHTATMRKLHTLLRDLDLHSIDFAAETVFARLTNRISRLLDSLSATEVEFGLSEEGLPSATPRVEFGSSAQATRTQVFRHDDNFRLLGQCLQEGGVTAWVILDRLDEAFQGFPAVEVPALRALLRTYLDMLAFPRIKIKLFLRRDLFRRVTMGGFVNLTHINAKRIDIVWDDEDLFALLGRRIAENRQLLEHLGIAPADHQACFAALFPDKPDPGARKPRTWNWMLSRIRDGNGVKPPRNLIDLVKKAQDSQLQKEGRSPREYRPGEPLIESESLKKGLAMLSSQRVEDTLLAEAGDLAPLIERFRTGKSEHNMDSLQLVLRHSGEELTGSIKALQQLGFLEQIGESFKIPMLYREGLGISQGKAFAAEGGDEDPDED